MNLQLIQGNFSAKEALEIIKQMMCVKIQFHENKINKSDHEEDIKHREAKIKRLQKDLYELREFIGNSGGKINIQSEIHLSN